MVAFRPEWSKIGQFSDALMTKNGCFWHVCKKIWGWEKGHKSCRSPIPGLLVSHLKLQVPAIPWMAFFHCGLCQRESTVLETTLCLLHQAGNGLRVQPQLGCPD